MGRNRTVKLIERIKVDLMVKSRKDYRDAILSLIEEDTNACLLDLGCGDPRRLSNKVMDRVGSRKLHGVDIHPGSTYQADLNGPLPIPPNSYDIIIASQVIEHLWNTDGFLKEIYRCLKPTGYAIISTPNLAAWYNRIYLLLGRQPEPCKVSDEMYPEQETPGHLRVFVVHELVKLLRFHGFKIERVVKTFGNVTVRFGKAGYICHI